MGDEDKVIVDVGEDFRIYMTPGQALEVAGWLTDAADLVDKGDGPATVEILASKRERLEAS